MVGGRKRARFADTSRIGAAIDEARTITSAPIHVSIAPYFWGSVQRTAERAFAKHRLDRTPERNAVLVFIVPSRRGFAIVGDAGAHDAAGQPTWDALAHRLEAHLRERDATSALVAIIDELARALAPHFPPRAAA